MSIQRDRAAYFIEWDTLQEITLSLAFACTAEQLDLLLALGLDSLCAKLWAAGIAAPEVLLKTIWAWDIKDTLTRMRKIAGVPALK